MGEGITGNTGMPLNKVKHVPWLSMFFLDIIGYLYFEDLQCCPFNTTVTFKMLYDIDFLI